MYLRGASALSEDNSIASQNLPNHCSNTNSLYFEASFLQSLLNVKAQNYSTQCPFYK
ncbi:hypothetical protein M378DRAFT_160577 [Amanita muscaria Koide BX008]|uniref:Uncharacterized protein n=1 Tax=Amanita muscaria (strain Koide BX008) TaxID=946122 RepID=A0A0C2TI11_AMAMK|nr:hypothetical protein M378DRAFT_160577 [Amanita muscaria Koide BX008]